MSVTRLATALAATALAGCGAGGQPVAESGTPAVTDSVAAAAKPPLIPTGAGHLAAMAPRGGLTVRDRPHGRVIAHLGAKTRWGSPTVVWAPEHRGRWLGVVTTAIGNNRIGWIDAMAERPRLWRSEFSLHATLSDRSMELRLGDKVVRRFPVTVGRPETPTPTGRFTVTDKLIPRRGSVYGCCVLALSGHQNRIRPGWAGGDRIAIHGSPSDGVGESASAGCLRARDRDLRKLLEVIPLGTPVLIGA